MCGSFLESMFVNLFIPQMVIQTISCTCGQFPDSVISQDLTSMPNYIVGDPHSI
jgi:hypothetical protein